MEIFKLVIMSQNDGGEVYYDNYQTVEDFIADNDWLVADGGAFYKRNKYNSIIRKFTANTFIESVEAECDECWEYNPNEKIEIMLGLDNIVEMLDANPNHICVKYGIEYDISYLVIHKDDWRRLRDLKVRWSQYGDWEVCQTD